MKKVLSLIAVFTMLLGTSGCADSELNDTLPPPEETTASQTTDFHPESEPPETDETEGESTTGEPETDETESEVTSGEPETSDTDEIPVAVPGDETWCSIHALEFHAYDAVLINYVGNDEFMAWVERCDSKTSEIEKCPYYGNIYNFIKEFDVPREVFEAEYYGRGSFYWDDHNIDLLYGDDIDAVNEYYMSYADREDESEKYQSLGEIKFDISMYAESSNNEKMQEFYETYCKDHSICEWSIADFVKVTGIEKGDLQALIEDIKVREYTWETIVINCFDFDYDALYEIVASKSADTEKEASVIDKHNEDLAFCRQPPLEITLTYETKRGL